MGILARHRYVLRNLVITTCVLYVDHVSYVSVRSTPTPQEPRFDHDLLRDIAAEWMVECGTRVKDRRALLKLHRRELADLAGTSEPTIIRIETGSLNPRDTLRFAIAGVLRCEVSELWPYPSHTQIATRAVAA